MRIVPVLAHGFVGAGLLVTALVGRAGASPAPKTTSPTPPTLSEGSHLLPCNEKTTVGEEGCAEHELATLDVALNKLQRQIVSHLSIAGSKAAFATAERDWLSFTSSTCTTYADAYSGGSIVPVEYGLCEESLYTEHEGDLKLLLQQYTEGLAGPASSLRRT